METINQYHLVAGMFLARVFLGFLFFFQGYDAIFKIKIKNVIEAYQSGFENKGIPKFLVVCAAWFTSYTGLIGAAFLIAGLFQYAAAYLLGVNLLIAAIGLGINNPLWDTKYAFPRLLLLLLFLLVPQEWNLWSFDNLIFNF